MENISREWLLQLKYPILVLAFFLPQFLPSRHVYLFTHLVYKYLLTHLGYKVILFKFLGKYTSLLFSSNIIYFFISTLFFLPLFVRP